MSRFSTQFQWADLVGHIAYDKQGKEVFNFGKHKGETLESVFTVEPAYYDWMMKAEFPLSTKELLKEVKQRMHEDKLRKLQEHFQIG